MRYLSTSSQQQALMLKALGLHSVEDLLTSIPESIRLRSPLDLPPALSEPELLARFGELEAGNAPRMLSFLGAGVNQHFIPLVIESLCSRGEFLTSYTPYQAEISQGTLQAVFEFQTFICQLTGMEISNASMYDGSSALAEAVLMARRISRRGRVLMARTVHPEYRVVVETVTRHQDLTIQTVDHGGDGRLDPAELETRLGEDVGALVVQSPNFLGNLESLETLADLCRQKGGLAGRQHLGVAVAGDRAISRLGRGPILCAAKLSHWESHPVTEGPTWVFLRRERSLCGICRAAWRVRPWTGTGNEDMC